jgi:hypothetical protein
VTCYNNNTPQLSDTGAHVTREYARHLDHTDLLRERVDGAAGVAGPRPSSHIVR